MSAVMSTPARRSVDQRPSLRRLPDSRRLQAGLRDGRRVCKSGLLVRRGVAWFIFAVSKQRDVTTHRWSNEVR